jgi:hypothetical protein
VAKISCGAKLFTRSFPRSRAPTRLEQLEAVEKSIEPLIGRESRTLLAQCPGILVERYDTDIEVEATGSHEVQCALERRRGASRLDACDRRLGGANPSPKLSLRESSSKACLPHELTRIHGMRLPEWYNLHI